MADTAKMTGTERILSAGRSLHVTENGVYYGAGTPGMFDEYVDFINYVFGFNGNSDDFKKLLPKLYRYELDPAGNSYVAVENGKIRAAVGAFDHDIVVCGKLLKTRGIGNVAVHPYERSRGFMRKLMNMAVDGMVADGVALSVLGGRRQRYNYFSYDKLGSEISMSFNPDNIRHTFGPSYSRRFTFRRISRGDEDLLRDVRRVSESQPLHAVRNGANYFDIITSWRQTVWAGFDGDVFAGYAVEKNGSVSELLLDASRNAEVAEFVRDLFDATDRGSLTVRLPVWLDSYIEKLIGICEHYSLGPSKSFSVLDYEKVCGAFFELESTYRRIADGRLTLAIDGRGGKEKITLESEGGVPRVFAAGETDADLELSHLEAMNLLCAPYSTARAKLPANIASWLPLPLYLFYSDAV